MNWGELIGPAVVAAVVSGVVTVIGFLVNRSTTLATHKQKLAADRDLAERRFEFDKNLAERKATLDAKSADRKRRQDLAEELIAGFYEINDIMRAVRSPVGHTGEGASREKEESEAPQLAEMRNRHFVLHERFNRHREDYARIMSREYRAVAWFGPEISKPFALVARSVNEVFFANNMLSENDLYPATTPEDRDLVIEWRRVVWASNCDKDKISAQLREALETIETICCPVLQEPSL